MFFCFEGNNNEHFFNNNEIRKLLISMKYFFLNVSFNLFKYNMIFHMQLEFF